MLFFYKLLNNLLGINISYILNITIAVRRCKKLFKPFILTLFCLKTGQKQLKNALNSLKTIDFNKF